jgi:hypothetical protein
MRKIFLVFLVMLCAARSARAAEAVAMLFHIAGTVEMRTHTSDTWGSAHVLQRLNSGDQIRCAPGAQAGIVILADGSRYLATAGAPVLIQATRVQGAQPLGKPQGLSARAAEKLAGARTGASMSRLPVAPQDLVYHFDGWLPAGMRKFAWNDPNEFAPFDAATYSFTLFDHDGNVVWSVRTARKEAEAPADIPDFVTERPYLWRLTGYSEKGIVLKSQQAWGMVTFLTDTQAEELQSDVKDLQAQRTALKQVGIREPRENAAALSDLRYYTALTAAFYRQHGVMMGAFDLLFGESMDTDTIYQEVGGLALFFKGPNNSNKGN